ncbi:DUF4392 domain-containing protein [Clostridiaceae bacterium]|nr:DUF4392 domain-containing protein [Clostridiaceae bacterium]
MKFYERLDAIMKQDFGARGLLSSLPASPLAQTALSLSQARHAILLTGFPVRLPDGSIVGETDGPSGTANLAYALLETGCRVSVVTDFVSLPLLEAALALRVPSAELIVLPQNEPEPFIKELVQRVKPTHFISLERPGKAQDGHYHNMRGEQIDDMLTDSAAFLSEAKKAGATTIAIGDGGNEMGMGAFRAEIAAGVACGETICAREAADLTLAGGVSNWWGWGIASLLSLRLGRSLLPSEETEARLLRQVVLAGGVDGATREATVTVDNLSLEVNLSVLRAVAGLTVDALSSARKKAAKEAVLQQAEA